MSLIMRETVRERRVNRWFSPGLVFLLVLVSHGYAAVPDSNRVSRATGFVATNAMALFQVEHGFRIELVAAEPLVASPVAIAFDENGRLYVAELPGAGEPTGGARRTGRVRLLQEPDDKGQYRASTLLADNISWASALACYGGRAARGRMRRRPLIRTSPGGRDRAVRGRRGRP